MTQTIKKITVDQIGAIFSAPDRPIETFIVNGEMAPVVWFRRGNEEYNGKYVIQVVYFTDDPRRRDYEHERELIREGLAMSDRDTRRGI